MTEPNTPTPDEMKREAVFEALGEASSHFLSNPAPGIEQVFPAEEMERIGHDLLMRLSRIDRHANKVTGYCAHGGRVYEASVVACVHCAGSAMREAQSDDS